MEIHEFIYIFIVQINKFKLLQLNKVSGICEKNIFVLFWYDIPNFRYDKMNRRRTFT